MSAAARMAARPRLGLAVLMLPTLLVSMDMFVLHFAVPELSADLQPSAVELLWIVDIYGFLVAGSLITMGTLGDRIGRRRLLLLGAAAFAGASVLTAFAVSPAMLIVARALLGLVGASLLPSTLALIRSLFDDERERGVAFGVWVAVFTSGGAIGPLESPTRGWGPWAARSTSPALCSTVRRSRTPPKQRSSRACTSRPGSAPRSWPQTRHRR